MRTYTQIAYHVVFATKDRRKTILAEKLDDLCSYLGGTLSGVDCTPIEIGGMEDHIHMIFALHPARSLAEVVKTVKMSGSRWMKGEGNVPSFEYWQEGYGAFTVSHDRVVAVREYIRNQREHHRTVDFIDEFRHLLDRAGIEYDLRYLP